MRKYKLIVESLSMVEGSDSPVIYSKGHHSWREFLTAVRNYNGMNETDCPTDEKYAEHQWWRSMPDNSHGFDSLWWRARKSGRGAMPVTVWLDYYSPELGYVDEMNG